MPQEEKDDVQADPSPALEQALDSASPAQQEQPTETETPTPQEGETQQEQQPVAEEQAPLHEHPRFKEVIDDINWYKGQLEKEVQYRQSQQQFQQPQQPQVNPYAHLTPEEQRWYVERDRQVDERVQKGVEKYVQQNVKPVIDAGRMEIAKMSVADFRRRHPDIKPNSPEELAIVEKLNAGLIPEDAYWSIMGPRGIKPAVEKTKQQYKQRIEAKKKANVESHSMPNQNVLPKGPKSDRAEIEANWDKLNLNSDDF